MTLEEKLAEALKSAKPQGLRIPVGAMRAWEKAVDAVAAVLAEDDPRTGFRDPSFNVQRFRAVADVEQY